MFERLRRLRFKENEITREETVGGVRFIYHKNLDACLGGISLGWVDTKRVIHLTEPERLVAYIKNHELAHHRRWNKPTMRCLRFFKSSVGMGGIIVLLVLSLALSNVFGTDIPCLIALGFIVFSYIICGFYEEHVANREARKICGEARS